MTSKEWESSGWLRKHTTSRKEITQLLEIVDRDLKDSKQTILSSDWRFGIAYNAALKLCTVLLYSEGYKPDRSVVQAIRKLSSLLNLLPS